MTDPSPGPSPMRGGEATNELDRWLLSELHQLVTDVTASLADYETMTPCRRIESFVEDLSNWYVRRSRRRFWKSEDDADKRSAYETLYETLVTLSKLLAPLMPFVAEELYQNLVRANDGNAPASVHLCDWPQADASLIDQVLNDEVRVVMRLASLGRSARAKAQIKVRQPVPRMFVKVRSQVEQDALARMESQLLDELNVREIVAIRDESDFLNYDVKPNLPVLGPKYGAGVGTIRRALSLQDPNAIAASIAQGHTIEAAGFQLEPSEVLVTTVEKEGFASAQEAGYVVVLDTEISDELRDEGLAREIVHRIQNLRRDAGFEISDRITTYWQADGEVRRVLAVHADYVQAETLSVALVEGEPPTGAHREEQTVDGHEVTLGVQKA